MSWTTFLTEIPSPKISSVIYLGVPKFPTFENEITTGDFLNKTGFCVAHRLRHCRPRTRRPRPRPPAVWTPGTPVPAHLTPRPRRKRSGE